VQGPLAEKSPAAEFFTQLEYIIWAVFPDDPVAAKVDEAVLKIEQILRPALEGQSA
jgi:hypothetical protein